MAFAGGATLPIGAAILSLVGSAWLRRTDAVRRLASFEAVLLGIILLAGGLGLAFPDVVPAEPSPRSAPALMLLAVSILLFGSLFARVWRTFVLTRRGSDLWTVVGVGWLATALVASLVSGAWSLPWWFGHLLETAGMTAIAVPVARDLRFAAPSRALVGDLDATELVASEEALLGPQVRALMVRLAEKDTSTEEHTRRVAMLAVRLGTSMGLSAARLRRLAIGGLLHDIGKLQVPDEILRKPGKLTDEEFDVIRSHPVWGDELAESLGFTAEVRRLIRSHHERLDGKGYPDGIAGEAIALDTRILTVCDVYDALTSPRVYRDAPFTHDAALELMRGETGDALCAECLAALEPLVAPAA